MRNASYVVGVYHTNRKGVIKLKHDKPEQPERLIKENEDEIDVRFDPIPKDPKRLEAIWDSAISAVIGGIVVGFIMLMFA